MKVLFINFVMLIMYSSISYADIHLPAIFSDNMVLQRNSEVTIWGWASALEPVTLTTSWSEKSYTTKANNQAYWEITITTPDIREPQEIFLKGYNEVKISNVLLGEVWLLSGQSNMEWSFNSGIDHEEEAMANANNSRIRFFSVVQQSAEYPQNDLVGKWEESTEASMKNFSAIGHFFGQKLNKELEGIPIGLINSSWGGTPAEAWMPKKRFEKDSLLAQASEILKEVPWGPHEPAKIFNAMISPITSFQIKGILWYQGESNTDNAQYYEMIFSELIKSWRAEWGQDLPFYYAQIAPYNYGEGYNGVIVRDAQRRVLNLPQTGMVMTSDIGDVEDIHPKNKRDVGVRFANLVLKEVYRKEGSPYAPLFDKIVIDKDKITVHFKNSEGLKVNVKNADSQFEVAGDDKVFMKVNSHIVNNTVVLNSTEISNPKYVRFAWCNTCESNITNSEGLPASSFTSE
jgi:sialate O-acetylesterase